MKNNKKKLKIIMWTDNVIWESRLYYLVLNDTALHNNPVVLFKMKTLLYRLVVECSTCLFLALSINPNKEMFRLYDFSIFELWAGGVCITTGQPE